MTADSSGGPGAEMGGDKVDSALSIQEDPESRDYFNGDYSMELSRVETVLDENPEFFQDYLIRKASRTMIDMWLLNHSLPPGHPCSSHPASIRSSESESGTSGGSGMTRSGTLRSLSTGSKPSGSGGATPIRKISAHEFEKGGLTKPLVTTIDGTPTFLSPPVSASELTGTIRKKSKNDLDTLDETDLILELVKDICNDLDVRSLCHKILQNVGILTDADRCSLFLVAGDPGKDSLYLQSNLFDVNSKSTIDDISKNEIRVPWGVGIVGYTAQTGESCNVSDCYEDSRFNPNIDEITGYRTRSMMCSPIKDSSGDVIGVSQVINKNNHPGYFTKNDETVFEKYLQFCGIGLRNAQIYERSLLEVKRNQVLLDLAGVIFQEQSTIDTMIHRILTHMLSLIQCERAMVMLVHEGSQSTFSRVFDLDQTDLDIEDSSDRTSPRTSSEGRFPVNAGITGYVAATGETVNIRNAYQDSRFDPVVDSGSDFKHSTVLAMPIKHSGSKVLGVFQLINKFDQLPFTSNDENFVEAFAIFCGMAISNVTHYEAAIVAMAKQQVTLEVLSYHATAPLEEAVKLSRQKIPSAASLQLHSFQFDDFSLEDGDTLKASLRILIDLDLINRFNIDYLTLCRWLCSVRRNYRSVTYHNWRHAHNVSQLMFAVITNTTWWRKLGEIECLSLIISCLCHDLDHRGTNNSFQLKASSPLATLYSTSTMEHHHFDQCLMILNTPGNQILANLSKEEFKTAIHVVEDSILATDLAVYFRRRGDTFKLLQSGSMDWSSAEHRSLLRGILMTACDLGAITKPWDVQKKISQLIFDEFFYQGDLERQELKMSPIPMMDRDCVDKLPKMQVSFIDEICMPVYDSLATTSEHMAQMLSGCVRNREKWSALIDREETVDDTKQLKAVK